MGLKEKFQKIPLKGGASGGRWGRVMNSIGVWVDTHMVLAR